MNSYKNCQPSWFLNPDIGKVFVLQKKTVGPNFLQRLKIWNRVLKNGLKKSVEHSL